MKKLLFSALGFAAGLVATAHATPMTIGGVSFDTDNAATDVLWAQGGVFAGLPGNLREACADPTDPTSTVGPGGEICRAEEVAGFNLDSSVELDENNTVTQDPDVLALFFDQQLANGDGNDLIIFETENQDDSPALTLVLNGAQLFGEKLAVVDTGGDQFVIWGFDFGDAPLSFAMGESIGEPIFLQTGRDDENTPVGSSDIAAVVGLNFAAPPPPPPADVPVPAAAPLFIAGAAGLQLLRNRRKRKA